MPPRASKSPKKPSFVVLRVELEDIQPPIWRRLRVPADYSLDQLHRALQLVFGWLDYHLYAFEIGTRRFEAPDPDSDAEDSTAILLSTFAFRAGARFEYTYDFGDGWVHEIKVEEVVRSEPDDEFPLPTLLAGERAGPHEDSGGPYSHADWLEVFRDPTHPEHRELREWAGEHYDPERFDPWQTNQNLMLAAAWGAI